MSSNVESRIKKQYKANEYLKAIELIAIYLKSNDRQTLEYLALMEQCYFNIGKHDEVNEIIVKINNLQRQFTHESYIASLVIAGRMGYAIELYFAESGTRDEKKKKEFSGFLITIIKTGFLNEKTITIMIEGLCQNKLRSIAYCLYKQFAGDEASGLIGLVINRCDKMEQDELVRHRKYEKEYNKRKQRERTPRKGKAPFFGPREGIHTSADKIFPPKWV